jgi:hypothetical protein
VAGPDRIRWRARVGVLAVGAVLVGGCTGPKEPAPPEAATSSFCRHVFEILETVANGSMDQLTGPIDALRSDADLYEQSGDAETALRVRVLAATLERLGRETEVSASVFLRDDATDLQISAIEQELAAVPGSGSVSFESKEQAYEEFKEIFKDQPELVEGVAPDALPASFRVALEHPAAYSAVQEAMAGLPGIEEVVRDATPPSPIEDSVTEALRDLCRSG